MARDPQIEEIRSRLDIVELVGLHVNLKRAGKDYKGLCPFHTEDTASFFVSPALQRYHCYGCQKSGDIFNFTMEIERLDFAGALQRLADRAGVTLQKRGSKKPSIDPVRHALDEAQVFFREQASKSQQALEFLDLRQVSPDMRVRFGIGFSPGFGDALAATLAKRGVRLQDAERAGLVQASQGGYEDRFRGRVMFPVRDPQGHIVGFGGRALGDAQPKYYNSPENELFKKREILYAFDQARDSISGQNLALLVEGYLDVIACHDAGMTNAVATLGTALSEEHAKLLKRWCERVVVLFDADRAGVEAAMRSAAILEAAGLQARIGKLTPGEDPDTVLKKEGPGKLRGYVEDAVDPMAFRLDRLEQEHDLTAEEGRVAFVKAAVALLAGLPSEVARESYIDRVARHVPTYTLDRARAASAVRKDIALALPRPKGRAAVRMQTPQTPPVPDGVTQEIGLIQAACNPKWSGTAWPLLDAELFLDEDRRAIVLALREAFPLGPIGGGEADTLNAIDDDAVRANLTALLMGRGEKLQEALYDVYLSEKVLEEYHTRLKSRLARFKRRAASEQAKEDPANCEAAWQEYRRLLRE